MEPMNRFVAGHRVEFKEFVDAICAIPADRPIPVVAPSYTTPIQIMGRLPSTSREGFPSLPFLIDLSKNFAVLTNTWVKNAPARLAEIDDVDPVVMEFHNLALRLQQRTKECMSQAEQAERPNGNLEVRWEELVESMERCATFHDEDDEDDDDDDDEDDEGGEEANNNKKNGNDAHSTPPTSEPGEQQQKSPSSTSAVSSAKPSSRTSSRRRIRRKRSVEPRRGDADVDTTTPPPSSSSATAYEPSRPPLTVPRWSEPRESMSSSKNSSTYSLDYPDSSKVRRASMSRDGGRARFFDFGKRKGNKDKDQSVKF